MSDCSARIGVMNPCPPHFAMVRAKTVRSTLLVFRCNATASVACPMHVSRSPMIACHTRSCVLSECLCVVRACRKAMDAHRRSREQQQQLSRIQRTCDLFGTREQIISRLGFVPCPELVENETHCDWDRVEQRDKALYGIWEHTHEDTIQFAARIHLCV